MKIAIILGHPDTHTFNGKLVEAYGEGALARGHSIKRIALGELRFDPILWQGYKTIQPLESDLEAAWQDLLWAEHWVFVFPTWWGTMPALLKGFIDRVFLPGRAFKSLPGRSLPVPLLKGRTAQMIVTMDSPGWYYRWITGAPGYRTLKNATLQYCGIKHVKIFEIPELKHNSAEKRVRMLNKVKEMGEKVKL